MKKSIIPLFLLLIPVSVLFITQEKEIKEIPVYEVKPINYEMIPTKQDITKNKYPLVVKDINYKPTDQDSIYVEAIMRYESNK